MSEKGKHLWLYGVMIFSAAILLILISAMAQSKITPHGAVAEESAQQVFNQTIQKSVTELIRENERLRSELKSAQEQAASLEAQVQARAEDATAASLSLEAAEFLLEAEGLFREEQYEQSRAALQNVNAHILSERPRALYDRLSQALSDKGFALQQ